MTLIFEDDTCSAWLFRGFQPFWGEFQQFYENDLKAQTSMGSSSPPPAHAQHPPKHLGAEDPLVTGANVAWGQLELSCHLWSSHHELSPWPSLVLSIPKSRRFPLALGWLRLCAEKRGERGTPQGPSAKPKPSWGFSPAPALLQGS